MKEVFTELDKNPLRMVCRLPLKFMAYFDGKDKVSFSICLGQGNFKKSSLEEFTEYAQTAREYADKIDAMVVEAKKYL